MHAAFKDAEALPRGPRFCRGCGYLLSGLARPRCPECGRPFDPADPRRTTDRRTLASLPKLRRLSLHATKTDDESLAAVRGLPDLRWLRFLELLNFEETRVTDAGLRHLEKLPRLQHLYVSFVPSEQGVGSLKRVPALQYVHDAPFRCKEPAERRRAREDLRRLRRELPAVKGNAPNFLLEDDESE